MRKLDDNSLAGQQADQPETMLAVQLAILAELRLQTGLLAAMNERGTREDSATRAAAACVETDRQVDALLSLCCSRDPTMAPFVVSVSGARSLVDEFLRR